MSEANLMRRLMVAASKAATIFRNNIGTGWAGTAQVIQQPTQVFVNPGDVVVRNARPLHAGLHVGSSDLIGWTTRTITPEMVGQRVAVFTAIEVKTPAGRTTPAQEHFLETVHRAGGIAIVARSEDDLARLNPPVSGNPNLSP